MSQPSLFEKLSAQDDPLFAMFWDTFNHKVDKGGARRAWRGALKKENAHNIIMAAKQWVATRGPDKRYWPYPATWLNGERWLEYQTVEVTKAKESDKLDAIAFLVKKRLHTTRMTDQDVLLAYRAGKVTAEECERYGVRV